MLRFVCGRDVAYPDPSAMWRHECNYDEGDFVTCGKNGGVVCPDLQYIEYMRSEDSKKRAGTNLFSGIALLGHPVYADNCGKVSQKRR
jgi:hypothetical protein